MSFAKNKLLNCFIFCGCRNPKPLQPRKHHHQNPKLSASSQRSPFTFSHRIGLFPAAITSGNDEAEEEEEIQGGDDECYGCTTHATPSHDDHNGEFRFEVEARKSMRVVSPCRKITNSIAFVKDSDDPYSDFKRSMQQMIFEREIRSKDDYEELLNCFLQLNPPSQHHVIILAFTEIWNRVFLDKNNNTANE